jgi:hypothetical protein
VTLCEVSIRDIAERLEVHCENFGEAVDLAEKLAREETPELAKLLEDITGISEDTTTLAERGDFLDSILPLEDDEEEIP